MFFAKIDNFFNRSNHFILNSAFDSEHRVSLYAILKMPKIIFFKAVSWLIMLYQDSAFNSSTEMCENYSFAVLCSRSAANINYPSLVSSRDAIVQ